MTNSYEVIAKESLLPVNVFNTLASIFIVRIIERELENPAERLIDEVIEITKSESAINRLDAVELSGVWRATKLTSTM